MGIDTDKNQPTTDIELRRQAEEQLKAKAAQGDFPQSLRLFHELQVHQVELEMQNAELRQARDEVDKVLESYTDLYDFAPVGYLTLDCDGSIRAVNLRGASLLGIERSRLIGQRFGLFVTEKYRPVFSDFLGALFSKRAKQACEVALLNKENIPLIVQIEAQAAASGQECRLALIDITARKQLEAELQNVHHKLEESNAELHKLNRIFVGRELKMIELKERIRELENGNNLHSEQSVETDE
jgi:PAS domain S-box-containing protein